MDEPRHKPRLRLSQVEACLCSHLVLAHARLEPSGLIGLSCAEDLEHLQEVRDFKQSHQNVRIMISVLPFAEPAGQTAGAPSPAEHSPEVFRQRCARSAMEFLHKFHLDGIDLNLEHATQAGQQVATLGLLKLLESLRGAIVANFYDRQLAEQHQIAANSNGSGRYSSCSNQSQSSVEPYLLTVALGAHEGQLHRISSQLDLRHLANLCDWLNVFTFDYYQFKAFTPFTGPNAPLYPAVDPLVPILGKLSLSGTLARLLHDEQVPADKLVLGVATYGRAYRLLFRQSQPSAAFSLATASRGGGRPELRSGASQECNQLGYREICDLLARPDTLASFDERSRVPYLVTDNGFTWISYENEASSREKVRFVLANKLAGYLTWCLNDDDHSGWPLHRAMFEQSLEADENEVAAPSNSKLHRKAF